MQTKLKPVLGAFYAPWPATGSGLFYKSQDLGHTTIKWWWKTVIRQDDGAPLCYVQHKQWTRETQDSKQSPHLLFTAMSHTA